MANPVWTTPNGSLGLIPENEFYKLQLAAHDPAGGNVTYKFLAGEFPPGVYVTSAGSLQGVPVLTNLSNRNSGYTFTIRASDSTTPKPLVSDRTFNLTISNIIPPVIEPRTTNLGEVFDGSFYSLQLRAVEVNPDATLTWSLASGSLPDGLTLSSTGLISGFITPIPTVGNYGSLGFGSSPFNEFSFENSAQYQNNNYNFTVRVFDGIGYDSLTYKISVIAKGRWEADTTFDTVDSNLTVDEDNRYLPIMTTPPEALSSTPVRSNSNFAFQFNAIDPNDYPVSYEIVGSASSGFDQIGFDDTGFDQSTLALPAGLYLDTNTGWLTGNLAPQAAATETYTFEVAAYETEFPENVSLPITYTLTVLGNINNTVSWTTTSNLGVIDNGAISEFYVSAVSNAGKPMTYNLVSGESHLPQGLEFLDSGLIVGRTTFEYFSLDGGTTTLDGGRCTFDNTYNFTVLASTTDNTATNTRTFTILVNNYNKTPYENLYLKALPTIDQRQTFLSIVNNTEIFPEDLIYRSSDPWFGRARDIRSLFLAGLNPSQVSVYYAAMQTNTYRKRIEFSDIKTAQALDANFNVKYEVVYIELNDTETYKGNSPANVDYDTIISANVYPNSFTNMSSVIGSALGYENQVALPEWMTSPQSNHKQLGFTRAIVLAYTVPGASNLIAYRLKANGVTFNSIDFVVDRYDLDNALTANYNTTTDTFVAGKETTFDRIVRPVVVSASASYGVRGLAFDMINNATVAEIQALGGFDGVTSFNTGDTLVFLQQEAYVGETNGNDGWNLVTNSGSTIIPGYLANLINPSITNQRSGIWEINISNSNVVTLTFVRAILPGQYVQINYGARQSNTIVHYNPVIQPGFTVPAYNTITTYYYTSQERTRFDNYGTKFINNRDLYADPEVRDTWLNFPKTNVFE